MNLDFCASIVNARRKDDVGNAWGQPCAARIAAISFAVLMLTTTVVRADEAVSAPAAQGNLQVFLHRSESGIVNNRCDAVLLAPDVIVARASCLDFAFAQGANDLRDFDVSFERGGQRTSGVAYAIHDSYERIDCTDAAHARACERAVAYCNETLTGLERNFCIAQRDFYARTYADHPGVDLVLVYLADFMDEPVAAVASEDRSWYRQSNPVFVRYRGRGNAVATPLRIDATAAMLPFAPSMKPDANLWASRGASDGTPASEMALLAIGSHFATLPLRTGWPSEYAFVRIDAQAEWIDAQLRQAALQGLRRGDAPLTLAPWPAAVPPAVPVPAPEPEPTPPSPPSPEIPESPSPELPPDPPQQPKPAPQAPIDDGAVQRPVPASDPNRDAPADDRAPEMQLAVVHRHGCQANGDQQWALLFLPVWPMVRRRYRRLNLG